MRDIAKPNILKLDDQRLRDYFFALHSKYMELSYHRDIVKISRDDAFINCQHELKLVLNELDCRKRSQRV